MDTLGWTTEVGRGLGNVRARALAEHFGGPVRRRDEAQLLSLLHPPHPFSPAMSSEREVVRLLKPDSQGHMQRIFSAYAFSSGTLEVLAFPSFPTLLKDLIASGPLALPAPLDERALFMVRPSFSPADLCSVSSVTLALKGKGLEFWKLIENWPSLTPPTNHCSILPRPTLFSPLFFLLFFFFLALV